ncbi:hypothetical protein LTR28_004467, partial [Elasticomyces elasticus]
MAMLASKSPYPAPLGAASRETPSSALYQSNAGYRPAPSSAGSHHPFFTSPTESEFSDSFDRPDAVRNWDEARVGEWLRSINCSQYVELFRSTYSSRILYVEGMTLSYYTGNNINGENLMDMDQIALKDMGVKKVGDRVKLGSQAKAFRNSSYRRTSKKSINR